MCYPPGLSPAVCVYIRSAALCCVSDWQSSWQPLSCPPNPHAALWLWTATFLSVRFGVPICLCAALCVRFSLCTEARQKDGWRVSVCWWLSPDLAGWTLGWICFHHFRLGEWAGNRKVSHPGLSIENEAKHERVTRCPTNQLQWALPDIVLSEQEKAGHIEPLSETVAKKSTLTIFPDKHSSKAFLMTLQLCRYLMLKQPLSLTYL